MSWNTSVNANVTITFMNGGWAAPPPPTCHQCSQPHAFQTNDGKLWCKPHLEAEQRRQAIAQAENWIAGCFYAVTPENRGRAYKQLAVLFHPDQGGDEKLMIALNNVRDKFR